MVSDLVSEAFMVIKKFGAVMAIFDQLRLFMVIHDLND